MLDPRRLYSLGRLYSSWLDFFWISAVTPVMMYLFYRYTERQCWKYINWLLIFVGTYNVRPGPISPPCISQCAGFECISAATEINYSSWEYHLQPHLLPSILRRLNEINRCRTKYMLRSQRHRHLLYLASLCCISGLVRENGLPQYSRRRAWRTRQCRRLDIMGLSMGPGLAQSRHVDVAVYSKIIQVQRPVYPDSIQSI